MLYLQESPATTPVLVLAVGEGWVAKGMPFILDRLRGSGEEPAG